MVEAGFALLILVFIVWWTMFSGRPMRAAPQLNEVDAADVTPKTGETALTQVENATASQSGSSSAEVESPNRGGAETR